MIIVIVIIVAFSNCTGQPEKKTVSLFQFRSHRLVYFCLLLLYFYLFFFFSAKLLWQLNLILWTRRMSRANKSKKKKNFMKKVAFRLCKVFGARYCIAIFAAFLYFLYFFPCSSAGYFVCVYFFFAHFFRWSMKKFCLHKWWQDGALCSTSLSETHSFAHTRAHWFWLTTGPKWNSFSFRFSFQFLLFLLRRVHHRRSLELSVCGKWRSKSEGSFRCFLGLCVGNCVSY